MCDALWLSDIMMLCVTSFGLVTSWCCVWHPLIESHHDVIFDILWFSDVMTSWVMPCYFWSFGLSHIMMLCVMSFDCEGSHQENKLWDCVWILWLFENLVTWLTKLWHVVCEMSKILCQIVQDSFGTCAHDKSFVPDHLL